MVNAQQIRHPRRVQVYRVILYLPPMFNLSKKKNIFGMVLSVLARLFKENYHERILNM